MIGKNVLIYPNVNIGNNCLIEDFSIIGVPPIGKDAGELQTEIGNNAIIRSHTVIYAGNIIGNNFITGHKANIRELNRIGDNVSIGTLSVIEHHINIEDNVRIHSQAFIPEFTILKNNSWIGPNVVITNAKYPRSPGVKKNLMGAVINSNAKIGANSTLLPGIEIGEWALIGAGSVVIKSVDPYAVAVGNPAKIIKSIRELPYQI